MVILVKHSNTEIMIGITSESLIRPITHEKGESGENWYLFVNRC